MFATSGSVSIHAVDDSKTIQTASPPPAVTPELADAATGQCVPRGAAPVEIDRKAVFLRSALREKRDIQSCTVRVGCGSCSVFGAPRRGPASAAARHQQVTVPGDLGGFRRFGALAAAVIGNASGRVVGTHLPRVIQAFTLPTW